MKPVIRRLLILLLILLLLPRSAALAEEAPQEESLIDEEYLNDWIETYRRDYGLDHDWQDLSLGFCYTATGDCWFYNPDVFMYSASMYKVPVCMLLAEQVAAGELSPDDKIQGSPLWYLEEGALIRSNNDYAHVLVSWLGGSYSGKCSDMAIAYTDLDESCFPSEFFDKSYYSARFMTQVMKTLYEGGEERFPHVIECLLQAQPEEYMNISLKDRFPVAQKYGAYDEQNGYNNNHDAAIIYTPNPIIVVVMTRNVGAYQMHIDNFGRFLAEYALELDEKLQERELAAAAATPEPTPEPTPAPTPEPTPAPTAPPPSPTPAAESAKEAVEAASSSLPPSLYAVLALLVLMAVPILIHAFRPSRKKARSGR